MQTETKSPEWHKREAIGFGAASIDHINRTGNPAWARTFAMEAAHHAAIYSAEVNS